MAPNGTYIKVAEVINIGTGKRVSATFWTELQTSTLLFVGISNRIALAKKKEKKKHCIELGITSKGLLSFDRHWTLYQASLVGNKFKFVESQ
jgi:hypothetical protein